MNIMAIVMAAAVIAVVGIVVGIGLGLFGEKFKVEVDEKELAIREELPLSLIHIFLFFSSEY